MRRTCQRVILRTGEVSSETTYGITSLGRDLAQPVHREDHGQTHTGSAPQALAALRNGIISRLRYRGWNNIAEALRHYGASVQQALQFIGWPAT